jgi:hypothetical protein
MRPRTYLVGVLSVVVVAAAALLTFHLSAPVKRARADDGSENAMAMQAFSIFKSGGAGPAHRAEVEKITRAVPTGTVDPASARLALDRGSETVHVIGGPKLLCLATRHAGGTGSLGCSEPSKAAAASTPLLAVDAVGRDQWRVTALFPDGVQQVVLLLDGSRRLPLQVAYNIATATVERVPRGLSWIAPDGSAQEQEFRHLSE